MQNYEPDVTQLLGLYQQLEDDIVADMVRRMLRMGFVSETTAYQAEVLQTAGILYDDILQMIADRTDASVAQVRAMFEDAGVRTVEIDNDTHEAAGEAPVDIRHETGAGCRIPENAGNHAESGQHHGEHHADCFPASL